MKPLFEDEISYFCRFFHKNCNVDLSDNIGHDCTSVPNVTKDLFLIELSAIAKLTVKANYTKKSLISDFSHEKKVHFY